MPTQLKQINMTELIKVSHNEKNQQVVSARELYKFLEVKTDFTDWIKRQFDYGFIENVDYNLLKSEGVRLEGKREVKREIDDYVLLLDCAKEISMIQRSEKGKIARLYFIECERKLTNAKTQIELIIESALILQQHESRLTNIESKFTDLENSKALAIQQLNYIERSTDDVPEVGLRLKINQIVRKYHEKTKIEYKDIWNSMYNKMLYVYHFNVNAYKKLHDKESKLDIIERCNQLDNLYALVSKELV
jgi:phage anti-repressor protein